jgi:hypothetical protein
MTDLTKLDEKSFADFAETLFEAEAKRRGLATYRTSGENKEHDLVVENPAAGQIYKVQVKASRAPSSEGVWNFYLKCGGNVRTREGVHRRRGYSPEGVDVFALVLPKTGDFYFIPNVCKPAQQLRLLPGSGRMYEGYHNLWNVFCIPMEKEFILGILGGECPRGCGGCCPVVGNKVP